MKRCSACRVEKTLSEFHANKSQSDGLCHACKPCRKKQKAESHQRNRPAALARFAEYRKGREAEVKAYNNRYYQENRERVRAEQNAKRRAAPEAYRARAALYYRDNKPKFKTYIARYKAEAPERLAKIMRRSRTKWEVANPHKVRNLKERRRLRLRGVQVVEFSHEDLLLRLSVFGHACAYCGGAFDALDHVKPVALGGLHILSNIRPACRACNSKKGAKSPRKWFAEVAQRKRA